MESTEESTIVINIHTTEMEKEKQDDISTTKVIKMDAELDLDTFYNNTNNPKTWNFDEMYIRSNSPIVSNFNSDIDSDLKYNSSIEDELPTPTEYNNNMTIHRKIKEFNYNQFNDVFMNRNYYNEDDMSNSQLNINNTSFISSKREDSSPRRYRKFAGSHKEYYGEESKTTYDNIGRSPIGCRGNAKHSNNKHSNNKSEENNQSDNDNLSSIMNMDDSRIQKKYKKLTYEDVQKSLCKYYDKDDKVFNEVDLLVTYLNGLRVLYTISKNITRLKSYSVALTTISITIFLAVIAPFVKDVYWGSYLISAGNALATILLTLSRYLKLDSNSSQYDFMAKQFNKILSRIEYDDSLYLENSFGTSSEINPSAQKINDIESTIMEMNGYIQELIPEEAVQLFPIIYRTNILRFIRKHEQHKKNLIIRLRDIKNEIHYILHKWNNIAENTNKTTHNHKMPKKEREQNRVLYLMELKEKTKTELKQCKSTYTQLDELFKKEIRYAETHQTCVPCYVFFKPNYDYSELNPIVREYLKLTIPD